MKWTATRLLCAALLLGCLAATASGRVFREGGGDPKERASFLSEGVGEDAVGASNGAGQDRANFPNFFNAHQQIIDQINKAKAELKAKLDELAEKGQPISADLLARAQALKVEVPQKLIDLTRQAAEEALKKARQAMEEQMKRVQQEVSDRARQAAQALADAAAKARQAAEEQLKKAQQLAAERARQVAQGVADAAKIARQAAEEQAKRITQALVDQLVKEGKPIPPGVLDAADRLGVVIPEGSRP